MSYDSFPGSKRSPAPCIVDCGTVVNRQDVQRLLTDLSRVRYVYSQDGEVVRQGEGYVIEVFADRQRSTLIANHALYLNVDSFEYLELGLSQEQEPYFDLIHEGRQLRLIPLSNPLQEQHDRSLNEAALEAMVDQVLSAGWDVEIDDEETF